MTIPFSKRWRLKIRNLSGTPKQWRIGQFALYFDTEPKYGPPGTDTGPHDQTMFGPAYVGLPNMHLAQVSGSSAAVPDSVQAYEESFVYGDPLIPTGHTAHYDAACANGNQTSNGIPLPPDGYHQYTYSGVPIYNLGGGGGGSLGDVFPYMTSPWITEYSSEDQWIEYTFLEEVQVANYYVPPNLIDFGEHKVAASAISSDPDYFIGLKDAPTDWDFQYWDGARWITIDKRRNMKWRWGDPFYHHDTGAFIGYVSDGGGNLAWEVNNWYGVQTDHAGSISVNQMAVEVLRDNGEPQILSVDQMAVEVLRFNGDEPGGESRDAFPGDNPTVGNWFSMF